MRAKNLLPFIALLFCGCATVIKAPLESTAAFSPCKDKKCEMNFTFSPDSIQKFEEAANAKSIYFGGKVFLFGDGFDNLWVGEIEENQIEFTKEPLVSIPASNTLFDWEKGMLKISWVVFDGNTYIYYIDNRGKKVEPKEEKTK
jgi:hypothetical protein